MGTAYTGPKTYYIGYEVVTIFCMGWQRQIFPKQAAPKEKVACRCTAAFTASARFRARSGKTAPGLSRFQAKRILVAGVNYLSY